MSTFSGLRTETTIKIMEMRREHDKKTWNPLKNATQHRIHKHQKGNAATFNYPPGGLIYRWKRVIVHSYVNFDQRVSWSWPSMICIWFAWSMAQWLSSWPYKNSVHLLRAVENASPYFRVPIYCSSRVPWFWPITMWLRNIPTWVLWPSLPGEEEKKVGGGGGAVDGGYCWLILIQYGSERLWITHLQYKYMDTYT